MTACAEGPSTHHFCPMGNSSNGQLWFTPHWVALDVAWSALWSETLLTLLLFLLLFLSQDGICMALWRLSLPSPASSPFIFHTYRSPTNPSLLTPTLHLLTPTSSICFLEDPDWPRWWLRMRSSVHVSELLFSLWKAKPRIPTSINVQYTTDFGLHTEH